MIKKTNKKGSSNTSGRPNRVVKRYPGKIRIIAGKWRGRIVQVLDVATLRPTPDRVRETLFNWLAPKIVQARCLDCFAGTGILGFEALSRGATQVTMLDNTSVVISELKKTRSDLAIEQHNCEIIQHDVVQWLMQQGNVTTSSPYDIVFLDAPFDSDLLHNCIRLLDENHLLVQDAWLYVEMPAERSVEFEMPGWTFLKSKIAGKVGYHLLAKI